MLGNKRLLLDHDGGPLGNLVRLLQGFEHGGSDDEIEDDHQENRGDRLPFHNIDGRVTLHPGSKHGGFGGERQPGFGVLSSRLGIQQIRGRHCQQQRREVRGVSKSGLDSARYPGKSSEPKPEVCPWGRIQDHI